MLFTSAPYLLFLPAIIISSLPSSFALYALSVVQLQTALSVVSACRLASPLIVSFLFFFVFLASFSQQFNCRPIALTIIGVVEHVDISKDAPRSAPGTAGSRRRAPIRRESRWPIPLHLPGRFSSVSPRSRPIIAWAHSRIHPRYIG
jgi:hypothetical protein